MANAEIVSGSGLTLPTRTEAEVRASMAAGMRAEGTSEARIAELTSDEMVKRVAEYERRTIELIASMFGGAV